MQLVVHVGAEDRIEQRVEVHGRVRVDAVEGAVVAREQHADVPVDADRPAEGVLQAKEQEGRADIFDDEIKKVDVECMQALRGRGRLVMEAMEVVPTGGVEAWVQWPEEDDVTQREQQVEGQKDRRPKLEREGGRREPYDVGPVHGEVGEH